ncbi:Uncharacterised protein [Serratia ficaria]|nr:hypothetical protein [Serratia ficaria]CAI2469853.1 Uncharacterised protein [Serratia ficaria]
MMAFFLTFAAIWAVIAFGLLGWFFFSFRKFCRSLEQQNLPPELRNYD